MEITPLSIEQSTRLGSEAGIVCEPMFLPLSIRDSLLYRCIPKRMRTRVLSIILRLYLHRLLTILCALFVVTATILALFHVGGYPLPAVAILVMSFQLTLNFSLLNAVILKELLLRFEYLFLLVNLVIGGVAGCTYFVGPALLSVAMALGTTVLSITYDARPGDDVMAPQRYFQRARVALPFSFLGALVFSAVVFVNISTDATERIFSVWNFTFTNRQAILATSGNYFLFGLKNYIKVFILKQSDFFIITGRTRLAHRDNTVLRRHSAAAEVTSTASSSSESSDPSRRSRALYYGAGADAMFDVGATKMVSRV